MHTLTFSRMHTHSVYLAISTSKGNKDKFSYSWWRYLHICGSKNQIPWWSNSGYCYLSQIKGYLSTDILRLCTNGFKLVYSGFPNISLNKVSSSKFNALFCTRVCFGKLCYAQCDTCGHLYPEHAEHYYVALSYNNFLKYPSTQSALDFLILCLSWHHLRHPQGLCKPASLHLLPLQFHFNFLDSTQQG